LNDVFTTAGVPIRVTRYSSLWMLNADPGLKYFSLLFYHLRLRGIHIWEGRGNFLSTAHTEREIDALVAAFADSVRALQQGGFFPGEPVPVATPATAPGDAPAPATGTPFSLAPGEAGSPPSLPQPP